MSSLLKLVLLLVCAQRGGGHRLRSLLEHRGEATSPSHSPDEDKRSGETREDENQNEGSGLGESTGRVPVLTRWRRASPDAHCSLRSVLLEVRDLGLGYDSDETVLFKYCSGVCPRIRSNHDLTLTKLLLAGVLPHPVPGELWHNTPCCRPSHHEDLAFLDNSHRWHKVEQLSAAGCGCVG